MAGRRHQPTAYGFYPLVEAGSLAERPLATIWYNSSPDSGVLWGENPRPLEADARHPGQDEGPWPRGSIFGLRRSGERDGNVDMAE